MAIDREQGADAQCERRADRMSSAFAVWRRRTGQLAALEDVPFVPVFRVYRRGSQRAAANAATVRASSRNKTPSG
jgi:hypothetical protein